MSDLRVRMRPDLTLQPHGRGAERYWVAADPLALKYFRLRDEECFILRLLDGRIALEEIRRRFEHAFVPLQLSVRELHAYLLRLHELGLVTSDAPGQGAVLRARAVKAARREWWATFANPLAIRLPGFAAKQGIDALYTRVRWMFSPVFLAACALLVLAAATLLAVDYAAFQARLPDLPALFTAQSAVAFAAAIALAKLLHELGHALVCRHFGGECREIGVMLLLFAPTLYCDVSDAWRFSRRRERILVSAAGMLVELVLAALAVFVWRFSEPGAVNALALRLIGVCSLGTLLFNLNPLVRCDGYYILSDLVGVPNLWQESRAELQRFAARLFLGADLPDDPTIPARWRRPLLSYAVLSALYRWLLLGGILWLIWETLEPRGLASLARLFTAAVLIGAVAPPVSAVYRFVSRPGSRRLIRRGRTSVTLLVTLGVVLILACVPFPHRVAAPLWLEADGAQPLYAAMPGVLREAVAAGTSVKRGDVLLKLVSPELDLQVADLARESAAQELRLKNLRILAAEDGAVAPQIPAAHKARTSAEENLKQRRADQAQLTIAAPRDGVLLPPPGVAAQDDAKRLAGRRGTPLDPANRGCRVEAGELLGLVGEPNRVTATLVIDQADVPQVRIGQRVRFWIDHGPAQVLTGRITDLARADAEDLSPAQARALDLPANDAARTYYQARVQLDATQAPLRIGMHGQARILADWRPPLVTLWQWLQRTFGAA